MPADLPTGTVTFLFTDIEGSTRLLQELDGGYADLLDEHRRTIRDALVRHHGVEVDTQGDAFFAAFASARDAANAAAELQREAAASPVRVRVGLHTGEAALEPSGYVGIDVHRAARICGAAHGGQILMSQTTFDLVDAPARDLGEHRLKDLTAPQRLYQLLVEGLADSFPPPRTLDAGITNLPVQPTALVGRERELEDARGLLARQDVRLLTLTGPAGAGKTRLAVQLAAEVAGEFEDGVYLVDLSPLRDPDLVVPTIAQTVGVRDFAGRPALEALADFLGERRMLLLLDNTEHVLDSASAIGRLLTSSRGLEVVATSREPLRLAAEQEYPVPPLSETESVELFAERARAVRPDFSTDANRTEIAEICARLDRLPLAIELAASRVKLLPPPKLLERLDQRFALLTSGARDAPERQQTLRAAIDWSFELLEQEEQQLFARLCVFVGGCALESAETVCGATIDGLASLVDKSLLAERGGSDGEPRFVMLETVLEYARELLRGEEEATLERRHAEHFLLLAEASNPRWFTGVWAGDAPGALRLKDELANMRAAIAWFRATGDVESELRLATAAVRKLYAQGLAAELFEWLASALGRADDADPVVLGPALGRAAFAASLLGDIDGSRRYAHESLELARARDDKVEIEWALRVLSFHEPDPGRRRELLRECEGLLLELGDDDGLAWIAHLLGQTFLEEGRVTEAREQEEHAISLFERLGHRYATTNARIQLGLILMSEDRHEEAATIVEQSLQAALELNAMTLVVECLEILAASAVERDAGVAARMLAAAVRTRQELGEPGDQLLIELDDRTKAAARSRLPDTFDHHWDAGLALSLEDAVALALGERR